MANVLLATPVRGGVVTVEYMDSMMRLAAAMRARAGISGRQYFLESSLINRARNAYATAVLQDPSITHLMFIDSDMGFSPTAVTKLLDFDQPFAGCICPYRTMEFERFHQVARQIDDPGLAKTVAQNYVSADRLLRRDGRVEVADGFARAERLGMALTLLRRDVLEQISEAHPDLWGPADKGYRGMGVTDRVFQPFEGYRTPDGLYLSEDMSFSRRWTELGGEIWACLDETVTHVGPMAFSGSYIERLRFEQSF
jgi:hypothetical protein